MPKLRYVLLLLPGFILLGVQPAQAAGSTESSLYSNPLAMGLLALMVVLLIVIGVLSSVLVGAANFRMQKEKKETSATKVPAAAATIFCLLVGSRLFAQTTATDATTSSSVGGVSTFAFYMMMSVIFLELLVILVLLMNVRILLKKESQKMLAVDQLLLMKKKGLSWWSKFNRFKPVEQEADIDLGHDYDGIRELDNRLPPWWLYGFYLTIIAGCIYLWRFHISHTGPSSIEEYQKAVASADADIKEYLKKKGESVDENTVVLLTAQDDLTAGKLIFTKSCVACHKETGAGDVGPNLTDDYWLHGGDIRSVFKTIRYGINAMPQWQTTYSNKEIAEVASYVKSLKGTNPPNPKAPQGELYKDDPVSKPVTDTTAKDSKTAMK
ncbi:MAG: cbb3-type cytochrome c oxidase N-terminal domain-containing protein [Chitinophagaceae bacterium]